MAEVDTNGAIFVGKGEKTALLSLAFSNRHGLVTGATGTGKTVTLQVLAEGLSRAGVPVFAADIKGDLSGISVVGEAKDALVSRAKGLGFDYQPDEFPAVFWDVFGAQGHPVRATISEMGPLLLSRMMDLNDVQEGVLNIAFRVADEQGLLLLDLKDLRAMLGLSGRARRRTDHAIRQRHEGHHRHHPAPASGARQPGRHQVLRRAGAGADGPDEEQQRRPRLRQHPGRRQADGEPAPLRDVPAVAVVGAVRADAGGRRSRQAEARVLLRRGASVVQRCAEGAARPDRAGGAADPLQGRRRVLRHAKSDRRAGQGAGPARQPRAACAARVHAARPEGGRRGGADVPAQSQAQHRPGHHRTRQGRGAGVVPRRQRHAGDGRARHGPAAVGAHRPDHAGGARQRSRATAR